MVTEILQTVILGKPKCSTWGKLIYKNILLRIICTNPYADSRGCMAAYCDGQNAENSAYIEIIEIQTIAWDAAMNGTAD